MSRYCSCGGVIPATILVDGVRRNLASRKFCLVCSPFGAHNTRSDLQAIPRPAAEKYRKWQDKARRERKDHLIALLGGRCSRCGYRKCTAALEFHHRDRTQKKFDLNRAFLLQRWKTVVHEAMKCDLLCANCHRELEDELRQVAIADAAVEREPNAA